jgi:exonuclease SbcC
MIPQKLVLKNFLSYQQATLDFRGFHTACICGANGAGKSSLLEAITWAVWGKSRAGTEDDVIYMGENDVRVDFEFMYNYQTYRIIRSRQRGRTSSVEFQLNVGNSFRSLSAKGLKNTQDQIESELKLDYDTFINSAYLRQGKADEFMLKGASDRKKILVELLRLDRYEELAEQAKYRSKQLKGQGEQLKYSLENLAEKLAAKSTILSQLEQAKIELEKLKVTEKKERDELQQIQTIEHQRQSWLDRYNWQDEQYKNLVRECDRLNQEKANIGKEILGLEKLINQESKITAAYNQLQIIQQEKETLDNKFNSYQEKLDQKQKLEQKLASQINQLELEIQGVRHQSQTLEQQEQDNQQILSKKDEIQEALQQLFSSRQRLSQLDKLQSEVAPLNQHRQNIQTNIEREKTKLTAKLEQLQINSQELAKELAPVPEKRKKLLEVQSVLEQLDKKKPYQARLQEKTSEKNNQILTLEQNQRNYAKQIEELRQKLILLANPEATCPLCEQPLDEHHRNDVIGKTNKQQQDLDAEIWRIGEEISICKRDIQNFRSQLSQITIELEDYSGLLQQQGQLEAQLENIGETHIRLQKIKAEIVQLENTLSQDDYAKDLQIELELTSKKIQALNYDEQTHSLVRSEEKKWRRAEFDQLKIDEAIKKQNLIISQKPQLLENLQKLQTQQEQLRLDSPIQQEINQIETDIKLLNYDRKQHNALIATLKQAPLEQLRYQQLQLAKQQYPVQKQRLQELEQNTKNQLNNKLQMEDELKNLKNSLEQFADNRQAIQQLEKQIEQQRSLGDKLIAERGKLEQSFSQIEKLEQEYAESAKQLEEVNKQYRVYEELSKAFGKNGIQSVMIENILPQLEAETNQILSRLTGNQLHVQFLTQKQGSSKSKKQAAKMIDTLEILIADTRGTRPYETYSGGETFRINFAIRLALAKLLAQRAGTSLQMLIIDEGFGTQDGEGCDRLIAAINAIAVDFSCILTVTHISQFKEAFHTRIEVYKTNQGSQLQIST